MSSNCGAPPAKASIAVEHAVDDRRGAARRPRRAARRAAAPRRTPRRRVLRLGDAVREQHQRVARLERAAAVSPYGRPGGSSPSGVPVDASVHGLAFARRISVSTCPAPTKRSAPVAGSRSTSAAVTYFSGAVDANSRSLACPASAGSDAVRPSSARSVACMLLITSDAGRPLPDDVRHAQQHARAPSGRRHGNRVVVVAAASARRAVAGGEVVAGQRRQLGGKQVRLDARRELELAFELGARHLRLLVQRQQPLALARRLHRPLEQPRVLDRGRRLQRQRVQQLELGGRVGHRQRAAKRDHADHPLADLAAARTINALDVVSSRDAPRVGSHVVDDLADTARGDRRR